jgi:hypothetical protein
MSILTNNNNRFDAIEELIFSSHLRIKSLDIRPDLNIMHITLNTGFVIHTKISSYPGLKKGAKAKMLNYKIIGNGTGIHWSSLDEDLSLKGFLKDELLRVVKNSAVAD